MSNPPYIKKFPAMAGDFFIQPEFLREESLPAELVRAEVLPVAEFLREVLPAVVADALRGELPAVGVEALRGELPAVEVLPAELPRQEEFLPQQVQEW